MSSSGETMTEVPLSTKLRDNKEYEKPEPLLYSDKKSPM